MSKYAVTLAAAVLSATAATDALAKTSFGGIIFTDLYSINRDDANNSGGLVNGAAADADDYHGSKLELPNISRLRASWSNEDNLGMYIEMGIGGASGATGVNTRQAYGTYKINDRWQILAGQSSSPFSPLFPSQLIGNNAPTSASNTPAAVGGSHNTGKGYGDLDAGRNPQLRATYTFPDQHGAIAVALFDPNQGKELELPAELATKPARESSLPRLDVGAAFNYYDVRVFPGFSYQKQSYNGVKSGSDDEVTTWAASLGVQTGVGPFEASAEYNTGSNWRNAGYSLANSAAALGSGARLFVDGANTEIGDTDNQSYWLDLGWRFTTKNTSSVLHLVYGAMESEADGAKTAAQRADHESTMLGLSWPIETPWMARGLTIRPEIFVYDEGKSTQGANSVDYGKETIAGVQMQFTF